ncbi:MAG: response regulator [Candidatus Latescibacteria bacterium]|nr:response regulator [Candidatus Latescibacterota bacterium]
MVDDDPVMRELFSEILELDDHRVAAAQDADSGAALIEAHPPDVTMIDAALEDDAGWHLAEQIGERWPSVRVVYLVDIDQSVAKRILERGRLPHFVRPFELDELRELALRLMPNAPN